jgi:hypothetical protein
MENAVNSNWLMMGKTAIHKWAYLGLMVRMKKVLIIAVILLSPRQ